MLFYTDNKKYSFMLLTSLCIKVLRGYFYKILKIKSVGPCAVGKNVVIIGYKKNFKAGKRFKIESRALIQTVSKNGITFGDNCTISNNAIIRPSGFYGGILGEGLQVGSNSSIGAMSYIGCAGKITIGDNVMIGPRVTMIAENHNFASLDQPIMLQGINRKGIIIKNNVWIGADVTILDGVIIESGCIIAAGAVVTKNTEVNAIYAGIPAKIIKRR
jgi:acetyltransferase-like isoleucine patch superfamily enzyme